MAEADTGHMGRQQHPVHMPERVILRQRLRRDHIQADTEELPLCQERVQGFRVHQTAATHVDEHCIVFHQGEPLHIKITGSLGAVGQCAQDKIGLRQERRRAV